MSEIIRNALTVDVEDYFQVSAFESHIGRGDWDNTQGRVDSNMQQLLDLFAEKNVKATFFTLGWICERYPQMIRRIVDEGHELASHGYQHTRATQQTREEFREDIKRTKQILEDTGGTTITGYRAASFSIGRDNLWALEELEDAGFEYSSSIYPVKHDLYGMPEASRFAFRPDNTHRLLEIPVSTVRFMGRNFPAGGGGYFRLYPYQISKRLFRHINQQEKRSAIFYMHPWEIDPEQPRPDGLGMKTRFRHYLNQDRMMARLGKLIDDFEWGPMKQVFIRDIQAARQ